MIDFKKVKRQLESDDLHLEVSIITDMMIIVSDKKFLNEGVLVGRWHVTDIGGWSETKLIKLIKNEVRARRGDLDE